MLPRFLYFLVLITLQCAQPSNANTPPTETTADVSQIQSLYAKGELGQLRLMLENKLSELHESDNVHEKAAILSMLFELYRVTGDVNGLINVVNTITESPILSDAPLQQFFALAASAYMTRFSWDSKNTQKAAEKLLKEIEGITIQVNDEKSINFTASIGIGTYPKDGETLNEIISIADECLYSAKTEGKNCVRVKR